MVNVLRHLFSRFKSEATQSSQAVVMFTRFGLYGVKAYRDASFEYLVFVSKNFRLTQTPYVVFASSEHACNDEEGCYCGSQLEIALSMVQKSGGVVIYATADTHNVDVLLLELSAKKIRDDHQLFNTKIAVNLSRFHGWQHTVATIMAHLNLKHIHVVSPDSTIVALLETLGVTVHSVSPAIAFTYGDAAGS